MRLVWGKTPVPYKVPAALDGPLFTLYSATFPAYKAFMMLVSVAMLVALYAGLTRTRVGLVVRAALTRPDMVRGARPQRAARLHAGVRRRRRARGARGRDRRQRVRDRARHGGVARAASSSWWWWWAGWDRSPAPSSPRSSSASCRPSRWPSTTRSRGIALSQRGTRAALPHHGGDPHRAAARAAWGRANREVARRAPGARFAALLLAAPLVFRRASRSRSSARRHRRRSSRSRTTCCSGRRACSRSATRCTTGWARFFTIHALNLAPAGWRLPVTLMPLVGGARGPRRSASSSATSRTRRAGTTFAMISLGIGEMVAACSLMFPAFFGGEAGISGNRSSGGAVPRHHVRPADPDVLPDRGVAASPARSAMLRAHAHAARAHGQRRARQPRARAVRGLRPAVGALHDGGALGLLRRHRGRARGAELRDRLRRVALGAHLGPRAARDVPRRHRLLRGADRGRDRGHADADGARARHQGVAVLLRRDVPRHGALRPGRDRGRGDAAQAPLGRGARRDARRRVRRDGAPGRCIALRRGDRDGGDGVPRIERRPRRRWLRRGSIGASRGSSRRRCASRAAPWTWRALRRAGRGRAALAARGAHDAPALELAGVQKRFGATEIVRGVDLRIERASAMR